MTGKFSKARLLVRGAHRAAAYMILVFLALHIANHLIGVLGVSAYNAVQSKLRLLYRNPVIEPLLLSAVAVQLVAGPTLLVMSVRQGMPRGVWAWLQIITGVIVFLTVGEHMIALYLARVVNGLDTTFYWPLSVMDGPPFLQYFAPYYFLLVAGVFAHAAAGLHYIGHDRGLGKWIDPFAKGLIGFGVVAGIVIVATLAQLLYDVDLPPEWIGYLRQFVPDYTGV